MFFQAALKGRNHWGLYLFTTLSVAFAYMIGQTPLLLVVSNAIEKSNANSIDDIQSFFEEPDFAVLGVSSNLGFLLVLLMFICAMIALYLCITRIHKRAFLSLVYFKEKIRLKRLIFGFLFWLIAMVLFEIVLFFVLPYSYTYSFDPLNFIVLLLISLLILPIQTSLEELFIRGYLMQWFGWLSNNRLIALLGSTFIFALIHGMNPEISEYGMWIMMSYYVIAGLILGFVTIFDDGLELALGAHAAINIYGALFVTYQGAAIQTDSLFEVSKVDPVAMTLVLIASGALFIFMCYKKYNWPSISYLWSKPFEKQINV